MTTPTDQAARRRALRRRHLLQRQTIIFGSMLVVLVAVVLAALGVLFNYLPPPFDPDFTDTEAESTAAEIIPCPSDGALPVAYTGITANVYNGSGRNGLAANTEGRLRGLGVATIAATNYPGGSYSGATLITAGPLGVDAAYSVAPLFPGATIVLDQTKADATIDIVLGEGFGEMANADEVTLDPSVPLVGLEGCDAVPTTATNTPA